MKRGIILGIIFALCVTQIAYAADQWAKLEPLGTRAVADIDSYVGTNNEALDRLDFNYRKNCNCVYASASTLTVIAGEVACPNAGGDVVRWRRNSTNTTVTWSNIDTGAEANSTVYYVYAVADTDATTFTVVLSTNSSAPSGATYYHKLGHFYNDSDGDITSVGNTDGLGNMVYAVGTTWASTTARTPEQMEDMTVYFVASKDCEVLLRFRGSIMEGGSVGAILFEVDGVELESSYVNTIDNMGTYQQMTRVTTLTEGLHTINILWGHANNTLHSKAAWDTYWSVNHYFGHHRFLIVEEF